MAKMRFKHGVMGSGKSQDLLRIWYRYTGGDILNQSVLLLAPKKDDRYGSGKITSRAGQQIPAHIISEELSVRYYLDNLDMFPETECVLVDEVQFLSKQDIYDLKEFVLKHDIPVIAFGLLKDYQNELFEGSQACVIVSEEVSEVETICERCRSKAIMNLRIDEKGQPVRHGQQIEVGGDDRYISVCHKHWIDPSDI